MQAWNLSETCGRNFYLSSGIHVCQPTQSFNLIENRKPLDHWLQHIQFIYNYTLNLETFEFLLTWKLLS